MSGRSYLPIVITLLLTGHALAREIPAAPSQYVLDEAGWLSSGEEATLARQLAQFERESSNQILVAVFRSLEGEDLADFSIRVAEAWGVGQDDRDNGILLAIYAEDRLFDIEVGYGLEGAVTDLIASQILEQRLRPAFRASRYAEGIQLAVGDLMAASRGEYQGSGRSNADGTRKRRWGLPPIFIIILILSLLGGRRTRRSYLGAYMLGSMLGGSGRGRGGGFGGGGFSGGGGSFGGGGARGGW